MTICPGHHGDTEENKEVVEVGDQSEPCRGGDCLTQGREGSLCLPWTVCVCVRVYVHVCVCVCMYMHVWAMFDSVRRR